MRRPATSTRLEPTRTPMVWHGWGDPAARTAPGDRALAAITRRIGPVPTAPHAPVPLDEVRVTPSRLSAGQRARLDAVVGAGNVRDDHRTRVEHAGGKSCPDLLRRRSGDATAAPDAVVHPGSHDEVCALLGAAAELGLAVVPFGGGTSVVGGVEPVRDRFDPVIAVDLARLAGLWGLDETSHIATFGPGTRGSAAESELRDRGFTLGHFPQSYEYATVGGYVATRSAGQASTGYGRIDDLVVGVRAATPTGTIRAGHDVATAAGPDLLQLLTGSEGTLGVLTEVSLRVRPAPAVEDHRAWAVPSFASGATLVRALARTRPAPDVVRLSDRAETATALAQAGGWSAAALRRYLVARGLDAPGLLILGWEGEPGAVARRRRAAGEVVRRHRAVRLPDRVATAWADHRFAGPYLRDELLDRGVIVDTLETATRWSRLGGLYAAVRGALTGALEDRGTPPLVLCHLSHLYPTGASLYFTWLAREDHAPIEQWEAAKHAASAAIVAAGGTITHHHGIGRDHRAWLRDEIGDHGVRVLRAVKAEIDPAGVCNPGKLLPDAATGP